MAGYTSAMSQPTCSASCGPSVPSSRASFRHHAPFGSSSSLNRRPKRFCRALNRSSQGSQDDFDSDAFYQQIFGRSIDDEWREVMRNHRLDPDPTNSSSLSYVEGTWDFTDDLYTPFPSNLPTTEFESSMNVLSLQEFAKLTDLYSPFYGNKKVYVILFGVGEAPMEGIYSLRGVAADEMPQDTIVAFEDSRDAQRYANLLEASMQHQPTVRPITTQELLEFCSEAGYNCRLEPCGSDLFPPNCNMGVTDWERSLKLRSGGWSVLDSDPQGAAAVQASQYESPLAHLSSQAVQYDIDRNYDALTYSKLSEEQLRRIKARLEALLPSE